jgi:hypothetical protein
MQLNPECAVEWPRHQKTNDQHERILGVGLHTQRMDFRASRLSSDKKLNDCLPGRLEGRGQGHRGAATDWPTIATMFYALSLWPRATTADDRVGVDVECECLVSGDAVSLSLCHRDSSPMSPAANPMTNARALGRFSGGRSWQCVR